MDGQGTFIFSRTGFRFGTHPLCRYVDSWDALSECFDELEQEKIRSSVK